jgi:hypothetical protein
VLASGKLGQHNGLPASIIVTTTLAELQAAAGTGLTGGGSILPMSGVIRLARHARHYAPASGRYPQAPSTTAKPWRCITPTTGLAWTTDCALRQ